MAVAGWKDLIVSFSLVSHERRSVANWRKKLLTIMYFL